VEALSKSQIRKDMKVRLQAQTAEDRAQKSRMIQEKVFALDVFQRATTVLVYASHDGEVETGHLLGEFLKLKKIIGLPKVVQKQRQILPIRVDNLTDDLESGLYGILEPKYQHDRILSLQELDLVVVPGLAYDRTRHRLGRGAGYYDRFLSTLPSKTITIGLAFDFQIIESLPERTPLDLPVSLVITN